MKIFFVFLLLPFFSFSQTVHVKDGNILYEGQEKVTGVSASEISRRIESVLSSIVSNYKVEKRSNDAIKARGELKLKTPYTIIRTVSYSIELTAIENGYEYLIDSVSFSEKRRGEKSTTKSSKEILDNMSEQGSIVGETEKLLNETDMRFQRLLALLKVRINKG